VQIEGLAGSLSILPLIEQQANLKAAPGLSGAAWLLNH